MNGLTVTGVQCIIRHLKKLRVLATRFSCDFKGKVNEWVAILAGMYDDYCLEEIMFTSGTIKMTRQRPNTMVCELVEDYAVMKRLVVELTADRMPPFEMKWDTV
jgi:hypothetical protein